MAIRSYTYVHASLRTCTCDMHAAHRALRARKSNAVRVIRQFPRKQGLTVTPKKAMRYPCTFDDLLEMKKTLFNTLFTLFLYTV